MIRASDNKELPSGEARTHRFTFTPLPRFTLDDCFNTLRRASSQRAYFFGFDFDVAVGAGVEVEFGLGLFGKIGNPSRLP